MDGWVNESETWFSDLWSTASQPPPGTLHWTCSSTPAHSEIRIKESKTRTLMPTYPGSPPVFYIEKGKPSVLALPVEMNRNAFIQESCWSSLRQALNCKWSPVRSLWSHLEIFHELLQVLLQGAGTQSRTQIQIVFRIVKGVHLK